jgi:hypothetical protein
MRKTVFWVMTGVVLGTLAGACGQGSSPPQDLAQSTGTEIQFRLPFSHIAGLTATLEISGQSIYPMTINADGTASATVPGISPGLHTFTVTYYRGACNEIPTILAQASTSAEIVAGQNIIIEFVAGEMDRNFDDDLDGWVNLAEVAWGADPCSADSFPAGEDPRRTILTAGGSVQSASSAIHDSVGEAVESGGSTSSSHAMRGGFLAYP